MSRRPLDLAFIADNPWAALAIMERYINDGSPSGFTFTHTTSRATSPRSEVAKFRLAEVLPRDETSVHDLGCFPNHLFDYPSTSLPMWVHPDMIAHPCLSAVACGTSRHTRFQVQPTASARTVFVGEGKPLGYVKLHYDGYLGRILRRVTLKHAQAAVETDRILAELVSAGSLPQSFAYFRETGARVYRGNPGSSDMDWGMVWRPADVNGSEASRIAYLIPAFSLFSSDYHAPGRPTILEQLGVAHAGSKATLLVEGLVLPLLEAYFAMLLSGGLQGEWHAQNTVFGFDEYWNCVATVLRDLESVDRDLPLMAAIGRGTLFESYPYKCLEATEYNYAIRHSFMFDHKFGEYLLAPLIDHACTLWGLSSSAINQTVINYVNAKSKDLPGDFFPRNGCWYKFAKQLIDQSTRERPYIELDCPRFRR